MPPPPAALQPPRTPAEWAAYYHLRYTVLRQPWQQPPGSERTPADAEPATIHALLLDAAAAAPEALAVGMLQPTAVPGQGQLRFMAVAPAAAGRGLGRQVVAYLEAQARAAGLTEIVLHSREARRGVLCPAGLRGGGAVANVVWRNSAFSDAQAAVADVAVKRTSERTSC